MQKTGFTKTVNGAFSKVKTKIMNLIKFGSVSLVLGDKGKYSQTQITYLGQTSNVTTLYPYGTYGNAPAKSLAVMFNIQGDESNKIAIVQDYESRFKNLLAGEVVHGNALTGSHVYYLSSGDVALTVKGAYTINTDGDYGLTLGGNHNVLGNEYTAIYSGNYSLSAGNAIISAGTDGKYSLTTTDDITFNPQGINPLTGLFTVNGDIAAGAISAVDLNISGTATFESGSETVFDGSILVNDTITFAGSSSIISEGDTLTGAGAFSQGSPEFFDAVIASMGPGLISVDGALASLVSRNLGDPTKFDILGGTGQIIDSSTMGVSAYKRVTWNAQEAIDPGFANGVFAIGIDDLGVPNVLFTGRGSNLNEEQFNDFILIGVVSISGGTIINAVGGFYRASKYAQNLYSMTDAIGPFNYSGLSGYIVSTKVGGLQFSLTSGRAYSQHAYSAIEPETPNVVHRTTATDPIGLVLLAQPTTGLFTVSPTGEANPLLVEKRGDITSFSSAAGGSETKVNSAGHDLNVGDAPNIFNSALYPGSYTITGVTGNSYDINTPFIGDDAPANWSSLSDVANNNFTGQRFILFTGGTAPAFIAIYYGQDEYATIESYELTSAEISEPFFEPPQSQAGVKGPILIISQAITDFASTALFKLRNSITRIR